jgi:hypothetical protein
MVTIEGYFSGEVVVPLEPNSRCPPRNWDGRAYLVRQSQRLPSGEWVEVPPNDVRILTRDLFVTCVNDGYYKFEIYGAKKPKEHGVLVDYKDRETGEVFEVFFKSHTEVTDTVENPNTRNIADKQFSAGSFKFANTDFH